jgi:hypothetical protein
MKCLQQGVHPNVEGEFEVPVDQAGEAAGKGGGRRGAPPVGRRRQEGDAQGRRKACVAPPTACSRPSACSRAERGAAGGEGGISRTVLGNSGGRRRACAAPKVLLLTLERRGGGRRGALPVRTAA